MSRDRKRTLAVAGPGDILTGDYSAVAPLRMIGRKSRLRVKSRGGDELKREGRCACADGKGVGNLAGKEPERRQVDCRRGAAGARNRNLEVVGTRVEHQVGCHLRILDAGKARKATPVSVQISTAVAFTLLSKGARWPIVTRALPAGVVVLICVVLKASGWLFAPPMAKRS